MVARQPASVSATPSSPTVAAATHYCALAAVVTSQCFPVSLLLLLSLSLSGEQLTYILALLFCSWCCEVHNVNILCVCIVAKKCWTVAEHRAAWLRVCLSSCLSPSIMIRHGQNWSTVQLQYPPICSTQMFSKKRCTDLYCTTLSLFVRSSLLITLIKCFKGHTSP